MMNEMKKTCKVQQLSRTQACRKRKEASGDKRAPEAYIPSDIDQFIRNISKSDNRPMGTVVSEMIERGAEVIMNERLAGRTATG